MDYTEAKRISEAFGLDYLPNPQYRDHLFVVVPESRKRAAEDGVLPKGESLDGFCIRVYGSLDNLPADVPKPENPYKGLLVLYLNDGPVLPQKQ